MRPACPALLLLLLALGGAALADENLVAKREACHAEARQRFKPKGRVTADLSKALLAKRQAYVKDCMERPAPKPRPKGR